MAIIFNFFFSKFIEAFFVGVFLRLLISLLFKEDSVSFWGFFNTGWVLGVLNCVVTYYLIVKYY